MSFSTTRNWGNQRLVHKQIYPLDLKETLTSTGAFVGDDYELWTPPIGQRIQLLAASLRIRTATVVTDADLDAVINAWPALRLKTSAGALSNTITLSQAHGGDVNDLKAFLVGPIAAVANTTLTVGAVIADITGGQDPTEAEHITATTRINELRADLIAVLAALNAGGGTVAPIITVDTPLLLDLITAMTITTDVDNITSWKAQLDLIGVLL